jgi:2-polyprenyl-6-methoxyphenol hydroxylase-like FAD-dependent oxidoreductase
MRAIIIGAGIGGLTTAIALRRAGVEAVIFERADELREVGAGITLWANAIKALGKLGVADAVLAAGAPVAGGEFRSWRGEVLYGIPAGALEERYGVSVGLHRADLQAALLSVLPDGAVRLGVPCEGFRQDAFGVTALFADGREERGDLLVGADGLNSAIRAQLFGEERPVYAGYTAWRGVVEAGDALLRGGPGFESWGRGERFGLLSIGRGYFYWFATANVSEGEEHAVGRKGEMLRRFGRWHEPIPAVIRATEESAILRHDVYDREPVKRWGEGRVTLSGDAAHPMTPNLGQGACQAMEDAIVLARCLKEEDSVTAALQLYEGRRVDRTTFVVRRSRLVGRIGQLEHPLLCKLRDALTKATPPRVQLRQLDSIVGYEV